MSGQARRVHVVVLNWNGWAESVECLESLVQSDHDDLGVTVVDNASTDGSADRLTEWLRKRGGDVTSGPRFHVQVPRPDNSPVTVGLLRNSENLGFAEGNNRGITRALELAADYLFILNNDTVVERDTVSEMVRIAERSSAGMIAPAIYDYANRDVVDRFGIVLTRSGFGYDRITIDDGPLLCPSGCAALYRRDLVESLVEDGCGFFDRTFFIYNEDVDVGLRATARGYHTTLASDAIVYHKGSSAWGQGSPRAYYLRHRNTVWTILKNYSTNLLIREAFFLASGQALAVMNAVRRRRFRAVLKGKWDGLLGAVAARRRTRAPRTRTNELIDRRFFLRGRVRSVASGVVSPESSELRGFAASG